MLCKMDLVFLPHLRTWCNNSSLWSFKNLPKNVVFDSCNCTMLIAFIVWCTRQSKLNLLKKFLSVKLTIVLSINSDPEQLHHKLCCCSRRLRESRNNPDINSRVISHIRANKTIDSSLVVSTNIRNCSRSTHHNSCNLKKFRKQPSTGLFKISFRYRYWSVIHFLRS